MTSVVFFGTPPAAVPALQTLVRLSDVTAVVTQPDKAKGRSGTPSPPPVKVAAQHLGLEVLQPAKMAEVVAVAAAADLAVLVAFGRLIPESLLGAPRLGMVNIHFSLLPRWRGAAPVQRAILAGDARSGVTLMQMDAGLDTGPVLASCQTLIGSDETAGRLTQRLAALGADLLAAAFPELVAGSLESQPQDERLATAAPRFSPEEARLTLPADPAAALRFIRGFSPEPGAWGLLDGERFKVLEAAALDASAAAGSIVGVGDAVALGTGVGAVELVTVQPAGKPPLAAGAWFNGRRREPALLS
jgi:methionyl-tRNA formyltransferase